MRGIGKTVYDVHVMPIRLDDGRGRDTKAGPDIGEQGALPEKLGALGAADPAGEAHIFKWLQKRRTFRHGFHGIDTQLLVHGPPHDRPQIVEA